MELRKGNLCFLSTVAVDLFYVVVEVRGEVVRATKLDAPRGEVEELPLSKVVKLAEEQEKLLPSNLMEAIDRQRMVVFTPQSKTKKKKKISLKKLFEGLPKTAIEEILQTLDEIEERRNEDND